MQMVLEHPTDVRAELSHSCIPGVCPNPCPYTSLIERDDTDIVVSPTMTAQTG